MAIECNIESRVHTYVRRGYSKKEIKYLVPYQGHCER